MSISAMATSCVHISTRTVSVKKFVIARFELWDEHLVPNPEPARMLVGNKFYLDNIKAVSVEEFPVNRSGLTKIKPLSDEKSVEEQELTKKTQQEEVVAPSFQFQQEGIANLRNICPSLAEFWSSGNHSDRWRSRKECMSPVTSNLNNGPQMRFPKVRVRHNSHVDSKSHVRVPSYAELDTPKAPAPKTRESYLSENEASLPNMRHANVVPNINLNKGFNTICLIVVHVENNETRNRFETSQVYIDDMLDDTPNGDEVGQ
ncbi:hypothetical protein Tco_0595043 [Tanacetum coccineum]